MWIYVSPTDVLVIITVDYYKGVLLMLFLLLSSVCVCVRACVQKLQSLETALKQCDEFVGALEKEASTWHVTADANLAIDQLEKEYSQTKVTSFVIPLLIV